MKKYTCILLVLILFTVLTSCKKNDDNEPIKEVKEVMIDKNFVPTKSTIDSSLIDLMEAKVFQTTVNGSSYNLAYRIYVPENYKEDYKYPLVVYFHGYGECGGNNTNQINYNADFLIRLLNKDNLVNYPAIVIAPQCPLGEVWATKNYDTFNSTYDINKMRTTSSMKAVVNLVNEMFSEYTVDKDRLYLTGLSMGGLAAWDFTARYPEMVACTLPVCSAASPVENYEKFENISVWAFHGLLDPTIRPTMTQTMVNAILANSGKAKMTIYNDADHTLCWIKAYAEEDFLDFMFTSRRGVYNKYIMGETK